MTQPINALSLGAVAHPDLTTPDARNLTFSAQNMNAANVQLALAFRPRAALTITRLALVFNDWSYGTAPTYRISLQGLDASGNPDGSIKGAGAAYADFTPTGTGNDGKLVWFTLGAGYTAAPGEALAIVLKHQSGTVDANNHTRVYYRGPCTQNQLQFPYVMAGAGAWTRQSYNGCPYAYGTADQVFGNPVETLEAATVQSDSNPNEYALAFTVPSDIAAAFAIRAVRFGGVSPPAGKSFTVTLYDSDRETALATVTVDSDTLNTASLAAPMLAVFADDPAPILYADTEYLLSIKPDQTSTALVWWHIVTGANTDLDAYPFGGAWYSTRRYNGGAWTDRPTVRPIITLELDALYGTYPPPDPDAIQAFPIVMISAADSRTPLEGLTVTAETMIDGANFVPCTNEPTEKSDGVYLIDLIGADQGQTTTLLKFSATGALTQFATLVR